MTGQQEARLLQLVEEIHAVATKKLGGGLVGDDLPKPPRPTKAETSANPGKYYKTADDPMAGMAPPIPVILAFETPEKDDEGNDTHRFISGTLYDWARVDLAAFLAWYRRSTASAEAPGGYDLNLSALLPEQRGMMGLPE